MLKFNHFQTDLQAEQGGKQRVNGTVQVVFEQPRQ